MKKIKIFDFYISYASFSVFSATILLIVLSAYSFSESALYPTYFTLSGDLTILYKPYIWLLSNIVHTKMIVVLISLFCLYYIGNLFERNFGSVEYKYLLINTIIVGSILMVVVMNYFNIVQYYHGFNIILASMSTFLVVANFEATVKILNYTVKVIYLFILAAILIIYNLEIDSYSISYLVGFFVGFCLGINYKISDISIAKHLEYFLKNKYNSYTKPIEINKPIEDVNVVLEYMSYYDFDVNNVHFKNFIKKDSNYHTFKNECTNQLDSILDKIHSKKDLNNTEKKFMKNYHKFFS